MKLLGVCGGIASGKSTAVEHLKGKEGCSVVNADLLGHEAYLPGTECYEQMKAHFGEGSIDPETKMVDRKKLGPIVFSDKSQLEALNGMVWPAIAALAQKKFEELKNDGKTKICVLEAAILVEAGWDKMCDATWGLEVEPEIAKDRLMTRNGFSEEEAMKRISSQMSNEERRKKVTKSISNNGTQDELKQKVDQAWNELLAA
eukprot:Clim_evm41s215 gene=Clim_evmTU41s215